MPDHHWYIGGVSGTADSSLFLPAAIGQIQLEEACLKKDYGAVWLSCFIKGQSGGPLFTLHYSISGCSCVCAGLRHNHFVNVQDVKHQLSIPGRLRGGESVVSSTLHIQD